ncbi:MAG: ABC transporter permease, partial [Phaeobacter italicus]
MAKRTFDVRGQSGFTQIAIACFVMLYMPIILLVVYSFNAGTSIAIWEGFSWRWYASAWANEQVQEATVRSLVIAAWASAISTTVAVLAALATTRTPR